MSERKKPYEKPAVIMSESLETKAVICTRSDPGTCSAISN